MLIPLFLPHFGCEDLCVYCRQSYITQEGMEDIEQKVRKISMRNDEGVEIGLYGGNILGLDEKRLSWLFGLFEGFLEKIMGFRISTKPERLKKEVIEILKRYKVRVVELGIPTFNDSILENLKRGHKVKDLLDSFFSLRKEGFECALQVMVGLPQENFEDIKRTKEYLLKLRPCYIRIYPLVILKGTPLYELWRKGDFSPPTFEEGVRRSLFLYLSALKEGIPCVKIGLTENSSLREMAAGGLYHPSFGAIVKDEAFFLSISLYLDQFSKGEIEIFVNKGDLPHLFGFKRRNIKRFEEKGFRILLRDSNTEKGEFIIRRGEKTLKGHIIDGLSSPIFQ